MCIDDHQRFQLMAVNKTKKLIFFAWRGAAWIDDDAFLGIIVKDVCVFRKGIEHKRFELEHRGISDLKF